MRKIMLNKATFSGATTLSREELKKVTGGNGNTNPTCFCESWVCTTSTHSIHLGALTCMEANDQCPSPFDELWGEDCE